MSGLARWSVVSSTSHVARAAYLRFQWEPGAPKRLMYLTKPAVSLSCNELNQLNRTEFFCQNGG